MNRIKQYIPNILIISVLLVACDDKFESKFDKSASERLNDVYDSCTTALTNSQYGWEMLYFFNNQSKGYNLLMDFPTTSDVTIVGRNDITNNTYVEEASTYELNNSNGPLIAFNTYNKVLHPFADPDPDGNGLGGDYEFVIVNVSSDEIELKGKKTGLTIMLNRIDSDISYQNYLNQIDNMKEELFSNGAPDYELEVDGEPTGYVFSGGANSVFSIENSEKQASYTHAFVTTRNGIRLCVAEEISGMQAQTFLMNKDKSALVSKKADNIKLKGPQNMAEYFTGTTVNWELKPSQMSSDVKNLYDNIISSVESKYSGANDIYLALAGISTKNTFSLRLGFVYAGKTIVADLYLDTQVNNTTSVTFSYNNSGNSAGIALTKSISGYSQLAQLLSSGFELRTDFPFGVNNLKFTKSSNNATWLYTTRL